MFWDDISYLKYGAARQQEAYHTLIELDIFGALVDFDPILVGAIPLGIDTPESDLDILCHADDLVAFEKIVQWAYGEYENFALRYRKKDGLPTLICNFTYGTFAIEIFGQGRPTRAQRAYRHLAAEARLLQAADEAAKAAIRRLKEAGVKTEPAFGQYFCLPGDAYETLLELADAPLSVLIEVVERGAMMRNQLNIHEQR
jgi:hypothetical protein